MATTVEETEAERLRLLGNDAFATQNWERARDLYDRSAACGGNAKTFGNLATTLCKLGHFEQAAQAAQRATELDSAWPKAWWRRGVVAEMLKLFAEAHKYYSMAVELDPKEKTFRQALKSMKKRLDIETTAEGIHTMRSSPGEVQLDQAVQASGYVAWNRFRVNNPGFHTDVYRGRQTTYPTSEQALVGGLSDWVLAMKQAVALLAVTLVPDAKQQFEALQRRGLPAPVMAQQAEQLLGGMPDQGMALQGFAASFSRLGGLDISLETGSGHLPGGGDDRRDQKFCPQPRCLSFMPPFQAVALSMSIHAHVSQHLHLFGKKACMSKGVLDASQAFLTNAAGGNPRVNVEGGIPSSPAEVVAYLQQQLRAGKTWAGGVRMYVSLQHRGTILYGAMIRLFGQVAECYKLEVWAREFITLADATFKVSEQGSYAEKGTCFRPSYRIGMMMSELQSQNALRGDRIDGPYHIEQSLKLCMDICEMARTLEIPIDDPSDYSYKHNVVAFRNKPLALAHSTIGSHLTVLEGILSREMFDEIAATHGLREEENDSRDPFAIIAEHYRIAAEHELPDSATGAIYWWCYAANMARAGSVRGDGDVSRGGYTLGELRSAITSAEDAERARDVGLFGADEQRGGTVDTLAKLTAHHYRSEADSFVLPQVKIVGDDPNKSVRAGDDIICTNYSNFELKDLEFYSAKNQGQLEYMDTSDVDKEHGVAAFEGVPTLEMMCIRELHNQECEFAIGETDAAVIHCKAIMAAQKKTAEAKDRHFKTIE